MKTYPANNKKNKWYKYYTDFDKNIKIPNCSIYRFLKQTIEKNLYKTAINYYGNRISFYAFNELIDLAARAFRAFGVDRGNVVTLLMPNTPEAIIAFYAVNKIGAIANMVHPLSGEEEIKDILINNKTKMLVMIDVCYSKVKNIINQTDVYQTVVTSASDSMPFLLKVGYNSTEGMKISKPVNKNSYISWKDFIRRGKNFDLKYKHEMKRDDVAVILHSGGTTGTPKGIMLTNGNFNALTVQLTGKVLQATKKPSVDCLVNNLVLGILPVFHGFGLGVTIHLPLCLGFEVVLIPRFKAQDFGKIVSKYRPTFIPGVPTLFEALIENEELAKEDLSFIDVCVCGGDFLSPQLEERVNHFFKQHGVKNPLYKGYGLTEATAAVIANLGVPQVENSIGIPLPNNQVKIVKPETFEELGYLEEGEICLSGPTVMKGYVNNKEETNNTLKKHRDKKMWLHTGDIGYMTKEGLIIYSQRLKRMIISSGYNVYPNHIEKILNAHPQVKSSCVIGIPHPYKVEVPKAFVVLNEKVKNEDGLKEELKKYCLKHLARYAIPSEFEFRESLPKTLIGKIDFKTLEKEEKEKHGK